MPQQDKEITDIIGIPRLTLHSWRTGSSHTKLLYGILKNMSVSELKEKRRMAEEVFNLRLISREELYEMLLDHESLQEPILGCDKTRFVEDIDITSKDDMILLRSCQHKDKTLIAHYIPKGSHTKVTAKKFLANLREVLSEREKVPEDEIEIHLYGAGIKSKLYLSFTLNGIDIKTHDLNKVLGIDKELVIMNHTDSQMDTVIRRIKIKKEL